MANGVRDAKGAGEWFEYQRLVLHELDRLDKSINDLQKQLKGIHDDVLTLKVKAAMWGASASVVVALLLNVFGMLIK